MGGQLLTVVAPIAEQLPVLEQRHVPPLVLAVVQQTLPEHEERLPLAYIVQSQSPAFEPDSHLITLHWHEPEEGQPGSAQQIPGAPSTAGLHGTVFEGPTLAQEQDPSTLMYMSLHEIPPPPAPELEPEPEPEPEDVPEEEPLLPLDEAAPELPPDDPDEELADASSPEGPPLPVPEQPPPEAARATVTATAGRTRARARRIGRFYAVRTSGLPIPRGSSGGRMVGAVTGAAAVCWGFSAPFQRHHSCVVSASVPMARSHDTLPAPRPRFISHIRVAVCRPCIMLVRVAPEEELEELDLEDLPVRVLRVRHPVPACQRMGITRPLVVIIGDSVRDEDRQMLVDQAHRIDGAALPLGPLVNRAALRQWLREAMRIVAERRVARGHDGEATAVND